MLTKAVHIELVSDLTTDSFIASLRRFISRRGKPSKLYSDNGSTFLGAHREIKELSQFFNAQQAKTEIPNYCVSQGIEWSFIPPHAPNFGGLWEAGIKSCKYHLKRVAGNAYLNFEEMTTLLVQIEAILNSRPLTPLSSDPNDLTALTPGHFLIGRELTSMPEPSLDNIKLNRLNRWQYIQLIQQQIWKRFSSEYISSLQVRKKWFTKLKIVQGMLVLVKDDNLPPMKWKLGRIIEVHPGSDSIIRVVTIKTQNVILKRSISKIAILPLEDST